ncbi:MAG: outer membrane lipid asymmetry maintenance protein MlaD [Psychromonas sp.]|nr:outer membrane lipid asymmetry maintenance protein MlaD [Psychromonas sp.]
MSQRKVELWVGAFVFAGVLAFFVLVLSVAGISLKGVGSTYIVYGEFNNVGGLKTRAPVKVGGVVVGRVTDITLDTKNLTPIVKISMYKNKGVYPETSSLSILTSGLLGAQYIALIPGFIDDEDNGVLKNGDKISDTKSALVLDDLIGKLIYSKNKNKK